MRVLYSMDDSAYQDWQSKLLAYSFMKVRQQGTLTRLVSLRDDAKKFHGEHFPGETFTNARWHSPCPCDDYPPGNKPQSIVRWLKATPSTDETILILDPDMVFLSPLNVTAQPGCPVTQAMFYMKDVPQERESLKPFCDDVDALEAVGVPTAIHRSDLEKIAPIWLEMTNALRASAATRKATHWISEMWAYSIACQKVGLKHVIRDMAAFTHDEVMGRPIVHYTFVAQTDSGWRWDKRGYVPWYPVMRPARERIPEAAEMTLRLIDESGMMMVQERMGARMPARMYA